MPEISYHLLILIAGFAVAVLALVIAVAVGPYGRRGIRFMFGFVALVAFAGSAAYLVLYIGMIDERRAIETRIAELRAQAMTAGPLACLERTGDAVEAACGQSLFASPGSISAARVYTTARLDALMAAHRYSGPRTPQFDDAVAGLQHSLQDDPFGLTADVLARRDGCTGERCPALTLFADTARLSANLRDKAFDANVARYTAAWAAPQQAAPPAAAPAAPASAPAARVGPDGQTRAPIPDKYQLPSSASIPPVSIMTEEPPRPPPAAAKERPAAPPKEAPPTTEAAAPTAEAPAPPEQQAETPPPPPAQKKQKEPAPRRAKQQNPSAPLSIAPQ